MPMVNVFRCSRRLFLYWIGVLILSGCASQPQTLEFVMPDRSLLTPGDNLVWPAPPDVPRYLYLGDLTGENNLKNDASQSSNMMTRAFNWLLGISGVEAHIPVVLQRPQSGITDTKGRIYVADNSRAAVMVFDPLTGTINVWDEISPGKKLKSPIAVALIDNDVLVTDSGWKKVFRFNKTTGVVQGSFGEDVLNRPTGIAVDPRRQRVYVSDTDDHNIKVFDRNGTLLEIVGSRGAKLGQFNAPTFLAVYNRTLYVSDTLNARVQMFSSSGDVLKSVGQRGLYIGDLTRPKGISLDEFGNLYVIESFYDTLLIYNPDGRLLLSIGGSGKEPGHFFLPSGVWTDKRNRIFVADMLNGRVSVFQYLGEN